MKPGDVVRRKSFKECTPQWKGPDSGHLYWGLNTNETGIVTEVQGNRVYIEGHGGWPHHIATLEVVRSKL